VLRSKINQGKKKSSLHQRDRSSVQDQLKERKKPLERGKKERGVHATPLKHGKKTSEKEKKKKITRSSGGRGKKILIRNKPEKNLPIRGRDRRIGGGKKPGDSRNKGKGRKKRESILCINIQKEKEKGSKRSAPPEKGPVRQKFQKKKKKNQKKKKKTASLNNSFQGMQSFNKKERKAIPKEKTCSSIILKREKAAGSFHMGKGEKEGKTIHLPYKKRKKEKIVFSISAKETRGNPNNSWKGKRKKKKEGFPTPHGAKRKGHLLQRSGDCSDYGKKGGGGGGGGG